MALGMAMLPEFDHEMMNTRKTLERVPEEKFAWKPHGKSFSMGDLASHIANMVTWTVDTMNRAEFDLAGVTPEQMNRAAKNRAELVSWFDGNVSAARASLDKPDADYFVPWTLRKGSQVLFTMPRYTCVRSFCLNHIVHHRAQLGVYLRMHDIPLPSVYGPSADEGSL